MYEKIGKIYCSRLQLGNMNISSEKLVIQNHVVATMWQENLGIFPRKFAFCVRARELRFGKMASLSKGLNELI